MTFENRHERIRNIILKNRINLIDVIKEFMSTGLEEEEERMMEGLIAKLESVEE
jgi:hypothetical protein